MEILPSKFMLKKYFRKWEIFMKKTQISNIPSLKLVKEAMDVCNL